MGVVTVSVDQNDKKDTLMKKADREYESADFDRALESYNKVLEIDPEEPVALFRSAVCDAVTSTIVDVCNHDNIVEYYVRADETLASGDYPDYPYEEAIKMLSDEYIKYIIVLGDYIHSQYDAPYGSLTSTIVDGVFNSKAMLLDLINFIKYGYCDDPSSSERLSDLLTVQEAELQLWEDQLRPIQYADFIYDNGVPDVQTFRVGRDKQQMANEQISILRKEIRETKALLEASVAMDNYDGDLSDYYQETKEKYEKLDNECKQLDSSIEKYDFIIEQNKGALFGEKAKARKKAEGERYELYRKRNEVREQRDELKGLMGALSARVEQS